MNLEELETKRQNYQTELEELHIYEPSEEWYKTRRNQLEYMIASVEEAIETEKESLRKETNVSTVFLVVLYSMVIIGLGILIFM